MFSFRLIINSSVTIGLSFLLLIISAIKSLRLLMFDFFPWNVIINIFINITLTIRSFEYVIIALGNNLIITFFLIQASQLLVFSTDCVEYIVNSDCDILFSLLTSKLIILYILLFPNLRKYIKDLSHKKLKDFIFWPF